MKSFQCRMLVKRFSANRQEGRCNFIWGRWSNRQGAPKASALRSNARRGQAHLQRRPRAGAQNHGFDTTSVTLRSFLTVVVHPPRTMAVESPRLRLSPAIRMDQDIG